MGVGDSGQSGQPSDHCLKSLISEWYIEGGACQSISDSAAAARLLRKKSRFTRPGPRSVPMYYGSVVEVMCGLVEELSREVVSELRAISQN